jgi:hypothetical protein
MDTFIIMIHPRSSCCSILSCLFCLLLTIVFPPFNLDFVFSVLLRSDGFWLFLWYSQALFVCFVHKKPRYIHTRIKIDQWQNAKFEETDKWESQFREVLKLWVRTRFMARCTRYNIMWYLRQVGGFLRIGHSVWQRKAIV